MENQEVINPEDVKPIQSNSVDLTKFNNEKTTIERAELMKVPSNYTELDEEGKNYPQWVLKVMSPPLVTIGEGEEILELRASELFNLIQDGTGHLIGYPTGEKANLTQFLKDLKVKPAYDNLKQLITEITGKEVIVKSYEKEVNGKKKTFLKFKY